MVIYNRKFKLPEEVEDGNWYRDARAALIGDREIVSLFLRNIDGTGSSKSSLVRWAEEW